MTSETVVNLGTDVISGAYVSLGADVKFFRIGARIWVDVRARRGRGGITHLVHNGPREHWPNPWKM